MELLLRASGKTSYQSRAAPGKTGIAELADAVSRLDGAELNNALRHRIIPVYREPGTASGHVVDAATGREFARATGRRIAGVVPPDWMRRALLLGAGPAVLDHARNGLARSMAAFSAARRLTAGQMVTAALLLTMLAGLSLSFKAFATFLAVVFAMLFLAQAALRLASIGRHAPPRGLRLAKIADEDLPVYTVLVPVFRETEIIDQLIEALTLLDYPASKLDIKLVLEETDVETRRHLAAISLPAHFECIAVPYALPQTKPKALNFALPFARGEFVTIFDAEDIPEAWQLRQAARTFLASDPDIVCLQARLAFYNGEENWLTRQFAIEYAVLFDQLLPLLASFELPLPLGGTSNHFRIDVLRRIGGWDPHNVTEDADLGYWLARFGYRAAVLPASTYEEANCQLGNWLAQRSRWLKGWLQTWLVHMRQPHRAWRELGAGGFATLQVLVGGTLLSALLHPLFLALAAWSAVAGHWFSAPHDPVSAMLVGISLVVLVTGYGFMLIAGFVALRRRQLAIPVSAIFLMPAYWLVISFAAWLALWQFVTQPFKWNKTRHGISRLHNLQ